MSFAGPVYSDGTFRIYPSVSGQLTWTNNVELESSNRRRDDLVFRVTPAISVDYEGTRTLLRGFVAAPIRVYANTGQENNEISPAADVLGRVELIDDFLFVEGAANIAQRYFNPFGARPEGLENVTENRYTSYGARLSPWIQGVVGSTIRYSLRNDNLWTRLTDSPANIGNDTQYTNRISGSIDRQPLPFGWGFDINRSEYDFPNQARTQLTELARGRLTFRPDPQIEVRASAGYERNRFVLSRNEGVIYGVGMRWQPTSRTLLDGMWEHRFFGSSYAMDFQHRTPRTVWSAHASRNITSYPELIASAPPGTILPLLLDRALRSRIPDPSNRIRFIVDYMTERGLPVVLDDPLTIYNQSVHLQEHASASVGLLGARNDVFFSVYRSKIEPVEDSLAGLASLVREAEQMGGGIHWSYRLIAASTLSMSLTGGTSKGEAPNPDKSDHWTVRAILTRSIGPRTTGYVGARYQALDSNVSSGYREAALFAGFNHNFR